MKRALVAFLTFVATTIVMTSLWNRWGQEAYAEFLLSVAPGLYDAIGFGDARVGAYRQRYVNFIPFIGLVLATPGLALRRRFTGIGLGLFALFVSHLLLNLTERMGPGRHLPFVPALISDTLPLIFWVIVAYPAMLSWFADGQVSPEMTPLDGPSDEPTSKTDPRVDSAPDQHTLSAGNSRNPHD